MYSIMNTSEKARKHIVVIGGGFAGLNFIRHLGDSKYYRITLVDKNNYNYFTPLLYQVATSFPRTFQYKLSVQKTVHGERRYSSDWRRLQG